VRRNEHPILVLDVALDEFGLLMVEVGPTVIGEQSWIVLVADATI
jgi:hypothetical protein